jgi:creatinine amidohydrolase
MNTCILAESTHAHIRSRKWDVAVLPFGATEPHNFHLPYGTDIFEADVVGRRVVEYAYGKGANVLLLPPVPFGVNTNMLQVPGALAISMTPTTLLKIIGDVADSLSRQGVKKLVLLNSHGGNELKPLAREMYHRQDVFIAVCDWFRVAADKNKEIFTNPDDHAGEMETSVALAFFPQFTADVKTAGPGAPKASRFEAVNKGWVSLTRPWHLLTADTGVGNPSQASAEKGQRLMAILTERIGQFLVDLARSPIDATFPFA